MVGDLDGGARLPGRVSIRRRILQLAPAVVLTGLAAALPSRAVPAVIAASTEGARPADRAPTPAYDVRAWTIEDGLPQSSVTSMVQTDDGHLWLGTYGGLVRFDGVDFETYSIANVPELPENRITALCVGTSGDLWLGMQSLGVVRRTARGFEPVHRADGAPVGPVWKVVADREGEVFVIASTLLRLRDGALFPVPGVPDLPHVVCQDPEGEVWVGDDRALVRWRAGRSQRMAEGDITSLALDRAGRVLVGDMEGVLTRLDASGPRVLVRFAAGPVQDLLVDGSGDVWVIAGDGLHVSSPPGPDDDAPRFADTPVVASRFHCLASDREGNVWAGAVTDGLLRVRRRDLAHLALGSTRSPVSDPAGALWCIADDRVLRVQDGRVDPLSFDGDEAPFPLTLLVDGVGDLWIGSERHGLLRYDGREVACVDAGARSVEALCERSDGSLWLSQGDLVGLLRDGVFVLRGRAPARVRVLAECAAGGMWVGTVGGVLHLADDGRWTALDAAGERELPVRSLFEDERGVLWVGTYGLGLWRHAPGEASVRYSRANGLPDDAILALVPDEHGGFWVNANRGPFHVTRAALEDCAAGRAQVVHCDPLQGIEGNGVSAGLRDDRGRYWFATVRGLSMLDPERQAPPPVPPGVVIRRCVVDGVERGAGDVVAPPGPGELELHFSAICFEDPGAVTYRYMLENYDRTWLDGGDHRTVRYSKVPPGEYVFRVRARSGRGLWSEADASLSLELRPAFYQTRRFLLALGALVVGTVWGAHRWRLRAIGARNRELEERIGRRTSELRTANHELEAFTYTVSHDLRAPLRHISYYASRIRADLDEGASERTGDDLQGIVRSTRRMSRLIDDLLTLSRLGRKEVVRTSVDTAALVRGVWAEVERAAGGAQVAFEAGDLPQVDADEKLLRHVWLNLLDNARKYSSGEPEPRVRVRSEVAGGRTWFRVEDNGVGFDQRYAGKLFVAFERLHSEEEFQGTGVGLAIAARMVEKHGGEIRGEGRLGEGATFEFTLDPN